MFTVAAALARLLAGMRPVAAEIVGLTQAYGRVLAEDVGARCTQPPLAVSAMDGYAVRAADVAAAPVSLRVIGEAAAGGGFAGVVGAGEAVRIFTGGPLPAGADTIVIQEHTRQEHARQEHTRQEHTQRTGAAGETVVVETPGAAGRHIRSAGLDFREGETLLRAGRRLTARDVALAAGMNVPWLAVRRRPRVACVATGDELVRPGEPLRPQAILNANGPLLAGLIRAWGGEAIDLGIAGDDEDALRDAGRAARGADLLVSSGGASVGARDLVRPALEAAGLVVAFHGVAMRPGKPILFGHLADLPVLGLPGNPVSAGVGACVFLKPALAALLGLACDLPAGDETALAGCALPANAARQDYLRARLERDHNGRLVATPLARQDSAMLRDFADADCLMVRPPHAGPLGAGDPVPILRFDAGA